MRGPVGRVLGPASTNDDPTGGSICMLRGSTIDRPPPGVGVSVRESSSPLRAPWFTSSRQFHEPVFGVGAPKLPVAMAPIGRVVGPPVATGGVMLLLLVFPATSVVGVVGVVPMPVIDPVLTRGVPLSVGFDDSATEPVPPSALVVSEAPESRSPANSSAPLPPAKNRT